MGCGNHSIQSATRRYCVEHCTVGTTAPLTQALEYFDVQCPVHSSSSMSFSPLTLSRMLSMAAKLAGRLM